MLPLAARSAQERFYLGVYTGPGKGEGIYTGLLDATTGRLGPITLAIKAANPGYLAFSRDASHLYSVTTDGGGSVAAFAIGQDGALTFLNSVPSGGESPCHLFVDPSGRNLLVANYSSGTIASIRINEDGTLGDRTALVQFQGSGPDRDRQQKPAAHFITTDAAGRFVYVCDLGTDHVWVYHFDAPSGRIGPPADLNATVPAGSGPRHLAFGPGEDFLYVNGEMGLDVTTFRRDKSTGTLTPIQTLPLLPGAGPAKGVTSSAILCHPSGRWLYVSSRGDDIIAVFAIGADGRLAFIEDAPCLVDAPRGLGIDPTGHWLIAAGQHDNRLAVFAIDQATGKLAPTGQPVSTPCPIDVLFAPLR